MATKRRRSKKTDVFINYEEQHPQEASAMEAILRLKRQGCHRVDVDQDGRHHWWNVRGYKRYAI